MTNFTVYNDKAINSKIEKDLEFIKTEVLNRFTGVKNLILTGGFGRGEGGVLLQDKKIIPVNDYDIVLITDKIQDSHKIQAMKKHLEKNLQVTWVDIKNLTEKNLKKLKLSIFNYDLKYASHVFYGNKEIVNLIPVMDAANLPLIEGEILFLTRLYCFLGSFSTEFLKRAMTNEEKFFLSNQMSKTLLACMDVMLLLKGAYHPSYCKRLSNFKKKYPENNDLYPLFEWALEFKVKPQKNTNKNLIDFYFEVKHIYFSIMKDFLSVRYRKKIQTWDTYARVYKWNFQKIVKRLGYLIFKQNLAFEKWHNISLAQLYIAASYQQRGIEKNLFSRGLKYLGHAGNKKYPALSWEKARSLAAKLRMEI